nr:DUF3494 domain-containing protein [Saprospiraceae bacterium]
MMKTLITTIALMAVFLITGCQKDDYEEIVGLCPKVTSTNPENGATGVPLDMLITVNFNTEIDPATINGQNFTLVGATPVTGIVSYSDSTATFRPGSLLNPNTTYTATINTFVKDITGNAVQTDYVWTFVTGPEGADLKTSARFGVFAGTGINNTGFSVIRNMDVGVSNAIRSSITGFPPAVIQNGSIFATDDTSPPGVPAMLEEAKTNLIAAYEFAENAVSPAAVTLTGDLGGSTLTPGIYRATNALLVQSGNLTLNARGDSNAVWIFQVTGNLNTVGGTGGNIILTGGAQAENIYWQTGNSATIGAGTSFNGNILALNSISLNSTANVVGRLLARNGTITLNTNNINKP